MTAADVADFVGKLWGNLDSFSIQIFFRLLQFGRKAGVELAQDILPEHLACLYFVQLGFHMSGKSGIYHVGELVLHQLGNNFAQGGGTQRLSFLYNVFTIHDRRNCGSKCGGTTDSLLFQHLDQRCFAVAGRRLSEVLRSVYVLQIQGFSLAQVRQGRVAFAILFVLRNFIYCGETGKTLSRVGSAEEMGAGSDVNGKVVIDCVCHLARQETTPDQLIKTVLLLG